MNEQPPEGWQIRTLSDFLDTHSLFCDGDWVESKDQDPEGQNRLIQLADIGDGEFLDKSGRFMNDSQFKRLRCTELLEGDILIARMPEPLGRACIFPKIKQRCATVVDVAILRTPKSSVDKTWLFYSINSDRARRQIETLSAGTTRTRISRGLMGALEFFTPEPIVQNRIGTILETIDEAIEQTEALIEKYSLVKAGMMHDLFTRGLSPDGKLRPLRDEAPDLYKETQIGWIPKEWDAGELKICVRSVQYGISTSLTDAPTGIPVLRMNNIQESAFDVSDMKFADTIEARALKLEFGDILYNRTNSMQHVGKTAIWRDELPECSFASYLVRVNLDEAKLDREYFAYWMSQVSSQNALRRYATPAVQQVNINPTNLQKIWISRPNDLDEQKSIVQHIDGVVQKTRTEQAKLAKLKVQKSGLMHDLLTGEVPVKIDDSEAANV